MRPGALTYQHSWKWTRPWSSSEPVKIRSLESSFGQFPLHHRRKSPQIGDRSSGRKCRHHQSVRVSLRLASTSQRCTRGLFDVPAHRLGSYLRFRAYVSPRHVEEASLHPHPSTVANDLALYRTRPCLIRHHREHITSSSGYTKILLGLPCRIAFAK